MSKQSPPHLLVERALALVPDYEDFLPLSDALIVASRVDADKVWARSGGYATVGKRVVDTDRVEKLMQVVLEKNQERLRELFGLVLDAVREQQAGNPAAAAGLLIRAGELEEAEGRLDKADRVYRQALDIARDLRAKDTHALALRRLGRTARTAGRLDEARTWYEQSYHLALDGMDAVGQVIACQGLGNVCDDRGERDRARQWWEAGLEMVAGLNAPELEWPLYANLSVLAMLQGNLPEAERLLGRARERMEAGDVPGGHIYWLNNRGLLLLEYGDAAGAETIFREALAEAEGSWKLTMRVNLGESLLRQGRLLEAEDEARRAEEIAIVQRLITDLVDVYSLLGSIARERCDDEGFVFYEQALRVCHERGLPRKTEAAILHGNGRFHLACARDEEGRAYLEAAREIYRELGFAQELARVEHDMARLVPELVPEPV